MKQKKQFIGGLVYSTHPGTVQVEESEELVTLVPEKQNLKISLDSKQRAGKIVTLVTGFIGTESDLETLGKLLKTKCGCGGTVKEQQIILQGDYKTKVMQLLQTMKYKVKG
ncbi:MAG: translation initiation factor [Bacteroidetes bacterium]|nr:translation initiation factor [Bacteroidota bacterium]